MVIIIIIITITIITSANRIPQKGFEEVINFLGQLALKGSDNGLAQTGLRFPKHIRVLFQNLKTQPGGWSWVKLALIQFPC